MGYNAAMENISSDLHARFRSNARRIRAIKGLTQTELAHKLGVSQPYVAQIEAGRNVPTLNVVERYAEALGVDATDLLESTEKLQKLLDPA